MVIKEIPASATWEIRHKVMWPDMPFEFVQLKEDDLGIHFGAYDESKLVAIVSCFEVNGEMQFRKLATLTEEQGKGFATQLLEYILQQARNKGVKRIWCNARVSKKSFYEKFGLIDTEITFFKSGQEFTIMELHF
ncbi:GNAT family N-acetyltransferase [Flavobacterium sp. F-65]|uniref:GNAT family N-acetyltransferase n=1 Tax=Flavobacterium pisciphilum TaxID=2893755 RepID=A0ABS8MRA3_9FLAO|nr:GNAT family N-acetyltransferase [Flavobacterium sp. F-65]MCC9071294.1 GNAT family N-acetyltransferase [Flavobacterium sp. F-65]